MIFVNDGLIQLSPHPLQVAFDLTSLFKAAQDKATEEIGDPEMADKIITFAAKLSKLPDEEIEQFLSSLPTEKPITFDDMITLVDTWRSVPCKTTRMYS